jgi:hypothetical protein
MSRPDDRPAASSRADLTRPVAALLVVLVVAWFPRLVPGFFASDDLFFLNHPADLETMVRQGRPGQAALFALLAALGADPVHAGTLVNWVALVLLALAAAWLLRIWDVPPAPVALLSVALVFVHPNLSETFSFRFTPVFFAMAMVLSLGGLLLARRGPWGWRILGGLLIAISFTVYQVTLNALLTVLALGVVLDCVRSEMPARRVLGAWAAPAAVVALAAAGYLVVQRLGTAVLGSSVQGDRSRFLPLDEVPRRIDALGIVFRRVLGGDLILSTRLLHALQLLLLAAVLGTVLVSLGRRRRWSEAALAVVGVAAALVSVVGVIALLAEFWPSPRVLTSAGVFWAGMLLVLGASLGGRWRWLPGAVAAVLLLGYAGIDHRVASDQARLDVRELALANRIIQRLESLPGWDRLERVAIIGRGRAVPGIPQEFDVNPSPLSVEWSQVNLLREVTDRRLADPTPEERERATRRCAAVEAWPSPASVTIEGPLAVVCLR